MNIVITGTAGLLGSHLSRHLLKGGHRVFGLDDFSGGYEDFLPEDNNFVFYERCLGQDSIFDIFEEAQIDCVFHFAAYAAEGLSPFMRHFNYQNNLIASVDVINECIKHDVKLVFTSSMAVYGEQSPPFNEAMETQPIDPYGIAKATVEKDIKQAANQFGLRYNIVRPHNVLGIYQNIWDKYRNVIGIFIRRTLNGEPIFIYGDGEQTRAFSDISFYMEPFEKLTTSLDGEIFNIGADKYWSIKEIANLVANIARKHGIEASIEHKEARYEVKHAFCDHSKAKQLLDFKDNTDIIVLIERMFEWAKTQPNRSVKLMNYEVEKGIYSFWKI